MADSSQFLSYHQRLALLRHNLHTASLLRSFTFFQVLQSSSFVSGVNQISTLHTAISAVPQLPPSPISPANAGAATNGSTPPNALPKDPSDMSDTLIATLDKFASIIAHVHEDAFRALVDFIERMSHDDDFAASQQRIRAEADTQRANASASIDKMFDQALSLIAAQATPAVREAAAGVFAVAITFVADAIAICLREIDRVEGLIWDVRRLDDSRERVSHGIVQAVSAFKGVYGLMSEHHEAACPIECSPVEPETKTKSPVLDVGSGARGWVRRMSAALSSSNVPVVETTPVPRNRRESVSSAHLVRCQTEPAPILRPSASMTHLPSASGQPQVVAHQNPKKAAEFQLEQPSQGINWGDSPFTPSWRKKPGIAPGKVPMKSGIANKLAAIPPTPAGFSDNVNPFDRDAWKHMSDNANENAFIMNQRLETLPTPSEDLDAGQDPLDPLISHNAASTSADMRFDGWFKNSPHHAATSVDAH